MELEIERLTRSCAELEEQVAHLTPLEGELTSPRDERALPALPNVPNPPTPRVRAARSSPAPAFLSSSRSFSLSPSSSSPPFALSRSTSSVSFSSSWRRRSTTSPSSSQEIVLPQKITSPSSEKSAATPLSSSQGESVSTNSTPTTSESEESTAVPPLSSSQGVSAATENATTPSLEKSTSSQTPAQESSASVPEVVIVPPISIPSDARIASLKNSSTLSNPHQPPQRYNSLPTLSPMLKDGLRGSVSPRGSSSHTPRATNSPRVNFSSTLLDSQSLSRSTKIPNFEVSLAKLAEMGPEQPPVELSIPADPVLAAQEISELKKRITELEAERLQMIAEYRTKKAEPTDTPTSSPLKNSVAARATTPPLPPVPTIQIPITKSGSLPPLPPTPTLPPPAFSTSPFSPFAPPAHSTPPSPHPSSQSTPTKPAQDNSPASSPLRLTRRNKKDRNSPSPTSGPSADPTSGPSSELERSNKAKAQNLTWIQASVCVAVGSAAFYLIQSLVHRYYA
eukprot:Phypoly_transcript_02620.p1 GENE.Phypoly_transcript_02620~~Phypoly_transcript_02620.p1  ORF type:complete len:509 (+),score=162.27 Phypoly_transcript_02620:1150-2676(+)